MERFILEKPVSIHGRTFRGDHASIRLEPVEKAGWYWHVDGIDVPIEPSILHSRKNRVVLAYGKQELHVFEHLGALRFSGLDSIRIVTKNSWLPYDGSSLLFWKACAPHMRPDGVLRNYSVTQHTSVTQIKSGSVCEVFYDPTPFDTLAVDVLIDYLGIGHHHQSWHFPYHSFGKIARVKTQGWPPSRRAFAKLASTFGWPHRHNAVWPQEHEPAVVKRLFARHRALDILGTLSVLCPPGGMLSGTYTSKRAGHAQDIELVKNAKVCPVDDIALLSP